MAGIDALSLKFAKSDSGSPAGETVTAESLGRQLRAMLPAMRLHSMSLYNAEGDVLWLSEGALGPDEHSVVLDAIQTLHGDAGKGYFETGLEDGRFGMFLPIRAPRGDLVGIVMLLTERKAVPDGTKEQLASARVRGMLQKIAVFLRVGSTRSGETTPSPAFPLSMMATDSQAGTASDAKVEEILTLELESDALSRSAVPASPSATANAPEPTPLTELDETQLAPAFMLPAATRPETVAAAAPPAASQPDAAAEMAADLALSVQELVKLRSSGRTRRYEVLARSRRDASRDEVPAVFIASSTSGSDGAALDTIVVKRLIEWLREHPQIWDGEPASFSINLSIGALEDESFPEMVAEALRLAGVPANSLGFEITEFACVQCKKQVQRFVAACEKMGCFVVLDNFTFDSAALPLLGSGAIRMVKIDPKLTSAAMRERLAQAVVIAISQACKVLGVHCIAKNVETQAALDWLEAIGCDFAQGFALEKPLSLQSLTSPSPTLPRVRGKEGKRRS